MRYTLKIFMLAILAVSLYVSPNLASSQSDTFSVFVNKPTYIVGETVIISGTVPIVVEGGYIAIQVFNPKMTPYAIDQVLPAADGTYTTAIKLGGKVGIVGLYTVKATYFGNSVVASFELLTEVESSIQNIKVEVEDQVFDVLASLTNGRVMNIDLEPDFKSLTASMQTSVAQNGTLQITLPRDLIDAREGSGSTGGDKSFMVLVGGKESRFNEINSTATSRTLAIPVLAGAQTVEIIGTVTAPTVIPELNLFTDNNKVRILFSWNKQTVEPGQPVEFTLTFFDAATNTILRNTDYNFKIFDDSGNAIFVKDNALSGEVDSYPYTFEKTGTVTIQVHVNGVGDPTSKIDISYMGTAESSINVVPEFPASFVMIIMALVLAGTIFATRHYIPVMKLI